MKLFPNRPEDMQMQELEPVVIGPPPYGSPDPSTLNNVMLPSPENPHATIEASDVATAAAAPADRKAAQWKEMIAGADEAQLESLREEYDDSGADFSSVEDAFDKREAELADNS